MSTTISLPQLRISASQVETFLLCPRKWFHSSVLKLPQPESKTTLFGTIIHGVLERYFRADERGYDHATGKPVDLYPEGWHIARSRWDPAKIEGEVNPVEQDQIKRLVNEFILAGYAEKQTGRMVETDFSYEVIPGVTLGGFIDLLNSEPPEVVDHKSTKSMKWARTVSPQEETAEGRIAKLRELIREPYKLSKSMRLIFSVQMLIYACEAARRWKDNCPPHTPPGPQDAIRLRHNAFSKDADDQRVRKIEDSVTIEFLETFWSELLVPVASAMQQLKGAVTTGEQIPNPPNMYDACGAYGGCPYRSLKACGGPETPEQYKARFQQVQIVQKSLSGAVAYGEEKAYTSSVSSGRKKPSKKENPEAGAMTMAGMMDFQAALKNMGSKPASAPQPTAAPQASPAPQQTFVPEGDAFPADTPPWAAKGCPSCKGAGINTNGNPCRMCLVAAKQSVNSISEMFTLTVSNGIVEWVGKPGTGAAGVEGACLIPGQEQVAIAAMSGGTGAKAQEVVAAPVVQQGMASGGAVSSPGQVFQPPMSTEFVVPARRMQEAIAAPVATITSIPVQVVHPSPVVEVPAEAPEEKKGRGRPKKGFILLAGGLVDDNFSGGTKSEKQGSGRYVYYLSKVLSDVLYPDMVTSENVQNYLEINTFRRWDLLKARGEQIAEMFANDIVIADMTSGQSDVRTLYDAIRPFAAKCFVQAAI